MPSLTEDVIIACCQVPLAVGDVTANKTVLRRAVTDAASRRASIVVLPELANTGYCFNSPAEAQSVAEPLDGPTVQEWQQLSRDHGLVLVAGLAELAEDGTVYNTAVLVDGGELKATYRKVHLWGDEQKLFTPGNQTPPVVSTSAGMIAVMVCYDLEFPEWVRTASLDGAEIVCAPVNWPFYPRPEAERPSEIFKVQANAATNRVYIAACDRTGTERGQKWLGGSTIVDPDGFPLALADLGGEAIITARITPATANDKHIGPHNDVHADRKPQLYGRVIHPGKQERDWKPDGLRRGSSAVSGTTMLP
ncbi:MAG: nitrilase-related carbon-nitrogen hydrolase [Arthrobacter sp.]